MADDDVRHIPFQGAQPDSMPDDLVIPGALELDTDERFWVPQGDGVHFRPLLFSTSHGYFVNLLRVRRAGILSRHRHAGPVHSFTLRGSWHYLEHDWETQAGTYAFEPPGETHTLVVPEDCDEMITLFHVTGNYVYVDPYGKAEGYEDVFTKLSAAREHYRRVGLGEERIDGLIR